MKRKIFKIICIAVVSLLSLAILVGAFMVAIITPKDETIMAAADNSATSNIWLETDNHYAFLKGTYTFNNNLDLSNRPEWYTDGWLIVDFNFMCSPPVSPLGEIYLGFCDYLYFDISSTETVFGYSFYVLDENREWWDTTEYDVYSSSGGGWTNGFLTTITFNSRVPYAFKLFLDEFATKVYDEESYNAGYDVGYEEGVNYGTNAGYQMGLNQGYQQGLSAGHEAGYNEGYDVGYQDGDNAGYEDGYSVGSTDGYERGYDEGYDLGYEDGVPVGYDTGYTSGYSDGHSDGLNLGHSDRITNPISSFIEPVHQFMNTPFFGTLTYATIFNIVLFVAVAVIFIKMFSGG